MTHKIFISLSLVVFILVSINFISCSKPDATAPVAPPDPCASKTIVVTATTTPTSGGSTNNGAINATATGSTGFGYSLNGGAFQGSGTFSALTIGTFSVTAKDASGCTGTQSFTVTASSCPTITITATTTPASNANTTNGSINATATGSTGLTYSNNGGTFQTTGSFTGLGIGTYNITAKDANGCTASAVFTVVSAACPTISLSSVTVPSDKCSNNTGSITVTSSGSTGLMFNLNSGTYQTSTLFGALATGSYTVGVKDVNGCTTTATAQVNIAPAGILFTNVKAILTANCTSCHGGPSPQNGINYANDCTIVAQKLNIKARAVDGIPSIMPASGAISAADKQKILDWVNAGGQHSN